MKTILLIIILVTSVCSQTLSYYKFFNGHWYASTVESMTWVKANEFASKQTFFDTLSRQIFYGHLVTITNAQEQQFVAMSYLSEKWTHAWLGAYREACGDSEVTACWVWVTGEPWKFTNWATGQPDKLSERCLSIMNFDNGNWHNYVDTIQYDPGLRFTIVEFEQKTNIKIKLQEKIHYSLFQNSNLIRITFDSEIQKQIKIFNLKSNLIRSLEPSRNIFWDMKDFNGRKVASGNYFIIFNNKAIQVRISN